MRSRAWCSDGRPAARARHRRHGRSLVRVLVRTRRRSRRAGDRRCCRPARQLPPETLLAARSPLCRHHLLPPAPGGVMQPFWVPPALPAAAMKTYQISAPLATHWRPATCEEAECLAYLHGGQTSCDESTELGQRQVAYIRHDKTRKHAERPPANSPPP